MSIRVGMKHTHSHAPLLTPELTNCSPIQNEMTNLCEAMAKKRNQTERAVLVKPNATPSNTAWRDKARMTKKPRRAAFFRRERERERERKP